ncbi:N-carbamoyl-L-amino acid amidohydrolase [Arthrobacter sp. Hiyo8]|nr:N-carbamoyl-L-amino acid amidohydrolase [Arthrobacter sp. Hiyo8]
METVNQLLDSIKDVGRDAVRGGYSRAVYSTPELDLRHWFIEQAQQRGLGVETDRNGIIWPGGESPRTVRSLPAATSIPSRAGRL